jgi:alkylhydroperoxidase family enzyme
VLDAGIAPELYENVAAYATYPGYTPRQRLAIEYAERFATDHPSIGDEFFTRLRGLFSDEEILDLTLCVAVFLGLGRSLTVLGVDQSCAIDV